MNQSHVIEVSGRFAGAAMSQGGAFRFVAVDPQVDVLDRSLWPSLPDLRQAVAQLMRTGRPPDRQPDGQPGAQAEKAQ